MKPYDLDFLMTNKIVKANNTRFYCLKGNSKCAASETLRINTILLSLLKTRTVVYSWCSAQIAALDKLLLVIESLVESQTMYNSIGSHNRITFKTENICYYERDREKLPRCQYIYVNLQIWRSWVHVITCPCKLYAYRI